MGSTQLQRFAVIVAILVLAQVGYVGYRDTQRTASLRRQVADIEQRSRSTLDELANELETERVQAQRARNQLYASREEASALAADLELASARVALLERLTDERPALEIQMVPVDGLQRFVVTAHNPGRRPVHIRDVEGLVWLDDEPGGFGRSDRALTIAPGGETEFFEFSLLDVEPALVGAGTMSFQAALCFSFERTLAGSSRAWAAQYWFEYNPGAATTAILRHEAWAHDGPDTGCQLEDSQL